WSASACVSARASLRACSRLVAVVVIAPNRVPRPRSVPHDQFSSALYREDGLSQPEIGRLMGHDKSWVNRRLALAEALSDELQADLRLGLVDATTGRELARLPRDNQREIATVVQRCGLTTRQTRTLADAWLAAPSPEVR